MRKQIWHSQAYTLIYKYNTGNNSSIQNQQITITKGNYSTGNDVSIYESAVAWSTDVLGSTDMSAMESAIIAQGVQINYNPTTTGNVSQVMADSTWAGNAAGATQAINAYNTIIGNNVQGNSTYSIPAIAANNVPFLVDVITKKVEFRNNCQNAIWVEQWNACPRKDFCAVLYGMQDTNAIKYGNAQTQPEYLYRLGIMGKFIANAWSSNVPNYPGGGGNGTSAPGNTWQAIPTYNITTSLRDCGYYNKYFKTEGFKRFLVMPGASWTASITVKNKWIDTQKLKADTFSHFVGFTKTLMMRAYSAVSYDSTTVGTTTTTVGSVPTVVDVGQWYQVEAKLKYDLEPRKTKMYFYAPSYVNTHYQTNKQFVINPQSGLTINPNASTNTATTSTTFTTVVPQGQT